MTTRREFKVVVIGDASVGKTSMANRLQFHTFDDTYIPTVGAGFIPHQKMVGDIPVELQIWDTAGSEKYRTVNPHYFRDSHAAVVVYDITNETTADNLENWIALFRKTIQSPIAIMIAGNKNDLPDIQTDNQKLKNWATEQGYGFYLTSALTGQGIDELFEDLAKRLAESSKNTKRKELELRHVKPKQENNGCC